MAQRERQVRASKVRQRAWVRRLAVGLSKQLLITLPRKIRLRQKVKLVPEATLTDGWCVRLGSISGERGSYVEVWLDDWTRARGRRVCFCLAARTSKHVKEVVKRTTGEFGKFEVLRDSDSDESPDDDQYRLRSPLKRSLFRKPIAELYRSPGSWSYLSLFHPLSPDFSDMPKQPVIRDGVSFYTRLVLALLGAKSATKSTEFPNVINRAAVRRHLVRERSATAAYKAKVRDSFLCRVCGFSFALHYGRLGDDFAEAHHVVPVATLAPGTPIQERDLVTVCSNCHRMLHRMSGQRGDVLKLRRVMATVHKKPKT
jgi:5-methylcytosine-specific restriction endonuclease McrA